ncbi:hypothetical protein F5B22DRAFT_90705 [Xylaria bambusicola]|uniref:uncharacterized protein n=1 Tax=Xylaria bambusicola TaxID=326684 RepID=UPI002007380C|nr:uncharacterized protein F5B22DRAFT_90705 [Xylaria bambusicola]KAI0518078.1 hypothetical protein F5B22DRAFT_90705 [Xylaria bambusicola]
MDPTTQPEMDKLADGSTLDTDVEVISSTTAGNSPPVPTTITALHLQNSTATAQLDHGNLPLSAAHTEICRKRTADDAKMPIMKYPKRAVESAQPIGSNRTPITPSRTLSSLYSLKVTKPIRKTQSNISARKHADTARFPGYQVTEQLTPQPTGTFFSLGTQYDSGNTPLAVANDAHDESGSEESSDLYGLNGISDDDLVRLLTHNPEPVHENHIPPSSVQGWDHGSQSAADYDPSLKFTPPDPQESDDDAGASNDISNSRQDDTLEDLLDEDVDWDIVLTNANVLQDTSSVASEAATETSRCANMEVHTEGSDLIEQSSYGTGVLTAFVRPSFPDKVRDRPSVPGMSSDTILRTCFRIGAMISQTACCHNHQQSVVFELYARVTYSSRETLSRKQHFQFVDLFKDQQPYPAATLTNWRVDSQLDKDSAAFLDTRGGPRLCWCMCRPIKDPKAAIGWTYTVLKIREIGWEEIRWAKRITCGDSEGVATNPIVGELP